MEKKETEALTEGALCGEFYVGEGKKVRFSKGNLQFNAVQGTHKTDDDELPGTWRFAEHQWDVIGKDNEKISETYDGFVDLFRWGASGWWCGTKCCQPWSVSEECDSGYDYYVALYGWINNLTGKCENCDWGCYNAISNGGDEPGLWRTLECDEWAYLFEHNKWTIGKIDGQLCCLLIPENVSGLKEAEYDDEGGYYYEIVDAELESNAFTAEQFKKYEEQGVVALPCGGYMKYPSVKECAEAGYYWSVNAAEDDEIVGVKVYSTGVIRNTDDTSRTWNCSVRLVQDV